MEKVSGIFKVILICGLVLGILGLCRNFVSAENLFTDSFEDGNSNGWSTSGGSWSVVTDESKVLKQSSTSATALTYTGQSAWTNYSVEARVKALSFNGTDRVLGLCARVKSSSNYYYLCLSNANKLELRKKVSGATTVLASKSCSVQTQTWYTLKLDVNGNQLQAFVNGNLELTATDSAIATGKVGFTSINTSAEFDDVKVEGSIVTSPSPTTTLKPSPTVSVEPTATVTATA
ncbi:MAG TPA: family 16 glycoside hydrolase, partial [Bacillota bacterium]|nr:family 16 glycoside hydrolase [Bacillota bacterium]